MNIILLSGGSGKRLWPLSNDIRSKQFLKLFKNPDGEYESMLQRVYRQITTAVPDANVIIATSGSQVSAIRNQLGDEVELCVEPCRRDTFPAIALATSYLYHVKHLSKQEVVIICPVDPYVSDDYFMALRQMEQLTIEGRSNLVLMGIQPTYPSEKYGYIIPADEGDVSDVELFTEKPSMMDAIRYIDRGALWNGGVFSFKLGYLLSIAHEHMKFNNYEHLLSKYDTVEKISFDYAVVETEHSVQVLRFHGEWKDIGTWNTLAETMEEPCIGNVQLNGTCKNVHVINELDLPILGMGLQNMVVSASPEGILVAENEQSSYIKPFVDRMERKVMFAEKSWGNFHVLDVESESLTIKVTLNPGHSMNYHSHERRDETWTVISGAGKVILDEKEQPIQAGDVITMPAGCRHTVIAETELKIMEVQLGQDICVEDKILHELPDQFSELPDTSPER